MTSMKRLAGGAALTALVCAMGSAVYAQETTGSIRGQITNEAGAPVSGATVVVTHVPSATSTTTITGGDGYFTTRGLRVGGPYTVAVTAPGLPSRTTQIAGVPIGESVEVDVALGSAEVAELVVTAAPVADTAVGPRAVFTESVLEAAPAINRDLRDVLAIDPRVYIDEAFVDAVQCGGANPRFNSLTVDGIRMNDNFGLNSSGYPTERMPFSYDAIQQVAVELAPFDVEYGGFTACNINAVTKSGGNTFTGSAFYDFSSDALTGDSLEGQSIELGDFEEKRWGVSLGGPIVRDRLFFFAAYEKLDGVNIFDRGPAGSGAGTEVQGLSQAAYNEIVDIANNLYGYDPGGIPAPAANEDEKFLLKLDLNITDRHRAAFTYNYNDGYNIAESDGDSDEFEFTGHLYERGAELNAYVGQLFSDWTDNFSTEARISYQELQNRQISLNGTDVGEVQINVTNDHDGDGVASRAIVYLGSDDSRHSNVLSYETLSFKFGGSYAWNNHLFSAGIEREQIDVFNLFVQHSEGEFRFNSVADFRNGRPSVVYYGNARGTNDPNDAAAEFGYGTNTIYAQDEWRITPDFVLTYGLRYDFYDTSDEPNANANFLARNGYANTETLDGKSLLQPRVGFTYDYSPELSFRGGFGLYSGGNPNVWLSNNYSNDGVTNIQLNTRTITNLFTTPMVEDEGGQGRPLYGVPQSLYNGVANGAVNSSVNAMDPNFEIPSEWKFALGATYRFDAGMFGEGYRLDLDLLHSKTKDAATVIDATLEQVATGPDGRPIYRSIDRSDPDCAVNPAATTCSSRAFNQDFILTNSDGGSQTVFSALLAKRYDWGLDWTLGYAYTNSDDVNPMTSSVAFSNFANIAVDDPNNPSKARSNYEIPHRFTLQVNYEREFFGDYATKVTLFGRANEGRGYSYSFANDDGDLFGDGIDNRHLLYVPTGPNDPNVAYAATFNQAAFFQFLQESGLNKYAGGIAPRNAFDGSWWTKFDLKLEQEFPGVMAGHKSTAFLVVENLGNLINDEWGVFREATFPQIQSVVDAASSLNSQGQYVYEEFFEPEGQSRVTSASLWSVRVGVRYKF